MSWWLRQTFTSGVWPGKAGCWGESWPLCRVLHWACCWVLHNTDQDNWHLSSFQHHSIFKACKMVIGMVYLVFLSQNVRNCVYILWVNLAQSSPLAKAFRKYISTLCGQSRLVKARSAWGSFREDSCSWAALRVNSTYCFSAQWLPLCRVSGRRLWRKEKCSSVSRNRLLCRRSLHRLVSWQTRYVPSTPAQLSSASWGLQTFDLATLKRFRDFETSFNICMRKLKVWIFKVLLPKKLAL